MRSGQSISWAPLSRGSCHLVELWEEDQKILQRMKRKAKRGRVSNLKRHSDIKPQGCLLRILEVMCIEGNG